jgi:hypothetical protein
MPGLAQRAEPEATAAQRDLMTPEETADELQVKPKTLANQRSAKVGPPYIKLSGGIVRYSRKAVRQWLEANTIDPGGAA